MKNKLFFIVIILLASTIFADYNEILNRVSNQYQDINTLEAELIQTSYVPLLNQSIHSLGNLYLQDDIIIVEFYSPARLFMILNNGELTLYSHDTNVAFINSIDGMQQIYQFAEILSQEMKFIEKNDNLLVFDVQNPVDIVSYIRLYINETTELIEQITYPGDGLAVNTVSFINQKFNMPLSKDINDFKIPENATIIRQ